MFHIRRDAPGRVDGVELKYTDPTPQQQDFLVRARYHRREVCRAYARRQGKIIPIPVSPLEGRDQFAANFDKIDWAKKA